MSFKMECPRCMKTLNVTEKAFGKTVPCPGCNQPITVPQPTQPSLQTSGVAGPPSWSGAVQNGHSTPDTATPLPSGMPPMPTNDGAFDFVNKTVDGPAVPGALAKAVQGLNLTDMFLGKEKEYVFHLLPGEERLDELMIQHQHLFVVQQGVTRVTLTSHRVLYTATRVFSPVYWLLLVLFPPLILYYVARMSRNRNVSLPLGSIDSVEKRYRPNWLIFLVAIILGYMVASLCGKAVTSVFGGSHQNALFSNSSPLEGIATGVVAGLLSPVVLVLLLATRIVGIEVRSCNNQFAIRYSPEDRGVSEGRIDAFLQNVHTEVERARMLQPQPNAAAM